MGVAVAKGCTALTDLKLGEVTSAALAALAERRFGAFGVTT